MNYYCSPPSRYPVSILQIPSNCIKQTRKHEQVAYSIVLVPIALARLSEFSGHKVPFWATVLTDIIFNLTGTYAPARPIALSCSYAHQTTGFVNVVLWYKTHQRFPDTATLPEFSMRRKTLIMPFSKSGVTPFTLMGSPTAESRSAELLTRPMTAARSSISRSSRSTMMSIDSVDSRTPLRWKYSARESWIRYLMSTQSKISIFLNHWCCSRNMWAQKYVDGSPAHPILSSYSTSWYRLEYWIDFASTAYSSRYGNAEFY